jgi:hypothetical protein
MKQQNSINTTTDKAQQHKNCFEIQRKCNGLQRLSYPHRSTENDTQGAAPWLCPNKIQPTCAHPFKRQIMKLLLRLNSPSCPLAPAWSLTSAVLLLPTLRCAVLQMLVSCATCTVGCQFANSMPSRHSPDLHLRTQTRITKAQPPHFFA